MNECTRRGWSLFAPVLLVPHIFIITNISVIASLTDNKGKLCPPTMHVSIILRYYTTIYVISLGFKLASHDLFNCLRVKTSLINKLVISLQSARRDE